jgi:cbb3-type cytochrome oxidase maturation protein
LSPEDEESVESLYILIPVTVVLLGIAVAAWLWSVGSGQYEDLDKAARSILFDEPVAPPPVDDEPPRDPLP